jgi:hypothetical protein
MLSVESSGVPGPPAVPVLGAAGNLLHFLADPLIYVERLFTDYGRVAALVRGRPTRLVSTRRGVPATVFVHPDLNHALLGNHEQFQKC